ncbi:MAG: DUF58 domain-containing protein [Cytophagaceae bacterium]
MNEILKKVKKIELQIRKAINNKMHGNFHSIFKGSGLEFADVRSYQYGDDVRSIDWNVSAKGHGTFIKTFKEEKDQNVFLILDVSASQNIGVTGKNKLQTAKEICAIMAFAASKENSHTGVICYSDKKELFIRPDKGIKHTYNLALNILKLQPSSSGTRIGEVIRETLSILKRKSIVILISDFIDEGYEKNLKALAGKHDLVIIHLSDTIERNFPKLGIIPFFDVESKKTIWVNSSSRRFRNQLNNWFVSSHKNMEKLSREYGFNYTQIAAGEDYTGKLIELFKIRRNKRSVA